MQNFRHIPPCNNPGLDQGRTAGENNFLAIHFPDFLNSGTWVNIHRMVQHSDQTQNNRGHGWTKTRKFQAVFRIPRLRSLPARILRSF